MIFTGQRVVRMAVIVGGALLLLGLVVPILLSPSNLSPLFGILIAGPVGAIAGAGCAAVGASRAVDEAELNTAPLWFGGVWVVTMAYSLLILGISPRLALAVIILQAFLIVLAAFALYSRDFGAKLPGRVRRARSGVLLLMIIALLATAFPPAISRSDAALGFTFVLDRRLDASRQVPLLVIRRSVLLLEWALAAGVAALLIKITAWRKPTGD